MDCAERSSGGDATRQKIEVGEEEDMVNPEAMSALGGARKAPTKRIVKGIPEIRFMPREVECSLRKR